MEIYLAAAVVAAAALIAAAADRPTVLTGSVKWNKHFC